MRGAFAPVFELQARVFLEALVGNTKLPDRGGMEKDVEARKDALAKRYKNASHHAIQVRETVTWPITLSPKVWTKSERFSRVSHLA